MDKTKLVAEVSELFRINGHRVQTDVEINHRRIDIVAEELTGLSRKVILIECADYASSVGVDKIQEDFRKLDSAIEELGARAIAMHISRNGYSPQAAGYALKQGIDIFTFSELQQRIINFDSYIESVERDRVKPFIDREYQDASCFYENNRKKIYSASELLDSWSASDDPWIIILGDYGVGKSWLLKKFLYKNVESYKKDPINSPLAFFVPLQAFTKAFDFKNLVLKSFENYGISGATYSAFEYLLSNRRVILLLDSFDEMAQNLSKDIIRNNLNELLGVASENAKIVMTSRPNYFENRSERLLTLESGGGSFHALDIVAIEEARSLAAHIDAKLRRVRFIRLNDLTDTQRNHLFRIVLGEKSDAYNKITNLFKKHQELVTLSQRAVIARLLTSVAQTLSGDKEQKTIDGRPLLPEDISHINQSKIFEIVIYNLLGRDFSIGGISAADRLRFLHVFAVYLQRVGGSVFASSEEVREIVRDVMSYDIKRSDLPEQRLENYYRACRRHSGLTTEGQFRDTSGLIDLPVDELDTESRVGFSHNSLREYLVSDVVVEWILKGTLCSGLKNVSITPLIAEFFTDFIEYRPELQISLKEKYAVEENQSLKEKLFRIIYFNRKRRPALMESLGSPMDLTGLDLSELDFANVTMKGSNFSNSLLINTDFRGSDLKNSNFSGAALDNVRVDGAKLESADFRQVDIISLDVYDEFDTKVKGILRGKEARQWLFSRGAKVFPNDDLNPLLGRPWYHAAREVAKTIEQRIAGTFMETALTRGTEARFRSFSEEFVEFLIKKGGLKKVIKSSHNKCLVVHLNPTWRSEVVDFSSKGIIGSNLKEFFDRHDLC